MLKLFNNTFALVALPLDTNSTSMPQGLLPKPGKFSQYDADPSFVRNIAFGIIAITLAVTGVLIIYLQYHRMCRLLNEASTTSKDLELGSAEGRDERYPTNEVEVCPWRHEIFPGTSKLTCV
jgi:hypothetical protein